MAEPTPSTERTAPTEGRSRRARRPAPLRRAPGRAAAAEDPSATPPRAPGRHVPGATLSAFLDDELDDHAALKVTRHVTACPPCRAELEGLRGTRAALRRLPGLQAPVLTAERRSLPRVRTWTRRVAWTALVLALLVAVLAAAWVAGGVGEVYPPVDRFLLDHLARTGDGPVPAPFGGLGR